ncbi:carbohydrate ABC transporter permease [Haloferax sp. YSSS75]|uniref:carbohydrate ABC transporter permease n=1 Tax=Haloferax sp. YSSS75 TaxID=3388564 RepID=UPI00398D39E1
MSLHSFGFGSTEWVGLQNYETILSGSQFLTTLTNTFVIAGLVIPSQVIGGLLIAVMLNSQLIRLRRIIRSGYLVPVALSMTVLSIVFQFLLSRGGLVNQFSDAVFGGHVLWLADPLWAKISVALVMIWRQMGISVLIYLAGLQGIPNHLYQAAKIDGANRLQQFRYITVPQLRPITLLVVILSTTRTVRLFDVPYVLTGGGPGNASKTIVQYLFETAFLNVNLGRAAAIGTVLTVILGAIMIAQYKFGSETQ